MDYFKNFPKVEYQFNDRKLIIKNITLRCKLRDYVKDKTILYDQYVIKDWDTPESLTLDYYDNYQYTWLIFFANDILDPVNEWPKNHYTFANYIGHKYRPTSAQIAAQEAIVGRTLSVEEIKGLGIRNAYQTPYAYFNEKGQIVDGSTFANNVMDEVNAIAESVYTVGQFLVIQDLSGKLSKIEVKEIEADKITRFGIVELGSPFNGMFTGTTPHSTASTEYVKSMYDYEEELNEAKRNIKLIKSDYAPMILQEFTDLIDGD